MIRIVAADTRVTTGWMALRTELWPETGPDDHCREIAAFANAGAGAIALLALGTDDHPIGFAEATLRHDYVNGCETSPVAFLEGLYVRPAERRNGVANALIDAVEHWARDQGVIELASDVVIGNDVSLAVHAASGFEETERVVYFRKLLHPTRSTH